MQSILRGFLFAILFSLISIHDTEASKHRTSSLPITLEAIPWFLNADGQWITHVKVKHSKREVTLSASQGEVTGVPSWYTQPTEIVIHLSHPSKNLPVVVSARSVDTHRLLGRLSIPSPADQLSGLQFAVKPIGPYLINVGWFNLSMEEKITHYRIYRTDHKVGKKVVIANLKGLNNFFHDDKVQPNRQYTYQIVGHTSSGKTLSAQRKVTSPEIMKNSPISTMRGVGATLFFTTDPSSTTYYKQFSPDVIFQQAKQLHVKYILLRTVYGSYEHSPTPEQLGWMDKILDAAHDEGIAVLSWCIPQRESSSTLALDVGMAAYTSSKGNTFAGIAVDLEIEKDYIKDRPNAPAHQQINNFVKFIRKAVGPDYLFSAIVYSPRHYESKDFPFSSIGKYASVIQPMEFWHYRLAKHHHKYTKEEVNLAIEEAIQQTRKLVGTNIPINVIGQITDLNDDEVLTGIPTGTEIKTALQTAKAKGALGICFYNWNDTLFSKGHLSPQAKALKNFVW